MLLDLGVTSGIIIVWTGSDKQSQKEHTQMHDFLIGAAFVLMVISPAIVAAFSNSSEVATEEAI